MFAYSYMFVRMYSRLADNEHIVSVSIDPTGTMLSLQVFNRQCALYENAFSEAEVDMMKQQANPALSWGPFFELLQKAFAEHTIEFTPNNTGGVLAVTLKHERQTEQVPIPAFTATLPVTVNLASKPDEIHKLCEAMISFVSLRTGDKGEMERVEGVVKIEGAIKEEAHVLGQELETFQEELRALEARIAGARRDEEQLVAQMNQRFGAGAWESAVSNKTTQELLVCRLRDPLRTDAPMPSPASPIDTTVMKLMKSRHLQPTSVAPTTFRHHCLITPMDRGDVEAAVAALGSDAPRKEFWTALEQAGDWEFDVMRFAKVCKALPVTRDGVGPAAGPLVMLGYDLFFALELASRFNVNEQTLVSWLSVVEQGHRDVPFHTALHAADVLQCTRYLLLTAGAATKFNFSPSVKFALFIAACISGFDHDGFTNGYHVATHSPLAVRYANQSVQQRHRVGAILELMLLPRYNVLDGLSPARRKEIEDMVLALVLATDLAFHDDITSRFRQKMLENCEFGALEDQMLAARVVFKAASLSFCARPLDIYLQWAARFQAEFSRQGEAEAAAGVAVSCFMDSAASKSLAVQARLQLSLINTVTAPVMALLAEVLPTLRLLGDYSAINRNHWANAEMRQGE